MVNCEWQKIFNKGNQIHNFLSSSGSGTVINYGSGSNFLTSYGFGYGSSSTSQKVTVPTVAVAVPVPIPQHCRKGLQPSKETIYQFKTWNFFSFYIFFGTFGHPESGS